MPRPPRVEIKEGIYHVTSRGNGRSAIFHTDEDRLRFLEQFKLTLQKYRIVLYAYVLMDNHYHWQKYGRGLSKKDKIIAVFTRYYSQKLYKNLKDLIIWIIEIESDGVRL